MLPFFYKYYMALLPRLVLEDFNSWFCWYAENYVLICLLF